MLLVSSSSSNFWRWDVSLFEVKISLARSLMPSFANRMSRSSFTRRARKKFQRFPTAFLSRWNVMPKMPPYQRPPCHTLVEVMLSAPLARKWGCQGLKKGSIDRKWFSRSAKRKGQEINLYNTRNDDNRSVLVTSIVKIARNSSRSCWNSEICWGNPGAFWFLRHERQRENRIISDSSDSSSPGRVACRDDNTVSRYIKGRARKFIVASMVCIFSH